MSVLSAVGIVLAGIAAELHFASSTASRSRDHGDIGIGDEGLAERAAVVVLRALGLKRTKA